MLKRFTPRPGLGRLASGSCSCQYVLLPRPVLGYPFKLTWLVLGGDPAARSHRVEQFTAL